MEWSAQEGVRFGRDWGWFSILSNQERQNAENLDPSVMLAPSLQPKDVIPACLLFRPGRDGHLMIPKGRFPITTTSHSPSQKPSGAKQEPSCLPEDKPYFPFPSPPLASPGGNLQTTPRLNTPPPRASLEVDPPRHTTGTRSASGHPGPRTHLRPWCPKRPHNQGQRRTQPPAPAEAAALGPAIRHAGSKRGVALGNCTSSPLGCWDLLVLILAFKHYKLFSNKTSAQGDETCCRKSHLLSTAPSSPPPEHGIALGLTRLRGSPPVSKWRPPSGGFCWLVVTGGVERVSACLALEPGFD